MSRVTNIIVTCNISDRGARHLNEVISGICLPTLREVSRYAHGSKEVEADIWIAAYNYLDLDQFMSIVSICDWESPEDVRVFVQDQDDNHFSERATGLY